MENRITDVLKKLKKKNKNVDDTFLLFRSKDHIEKFRGCLNCQHPNLIKKRRSANAQYLIL